MLRIQSLTRSFGPRRAVDGLDLEVRPGETFGFLGPNGAGKSTTMACAVGALRPDSGTVTIGDFGAPTDPRVRRHIGYAPQDLAIYGELTGEENVRFFGRLQGLTGAHLAARTAAVLDLVGLTERRADVAAKYSGGMKRRLNLACALVHDPDLLFLDEPTAGVDPQSRNLLFETVGRLREQGKTIVYTTHYMEEATRLCGRVAIVDHGRVLAVGTVDALVAAHGGRPVLVLHCDGPTPADCGLPVADAAGVIRVETADPPAELARITALGVRYREAWVHRPDLEAVFLALTGKRLRDDA